MLKWQDLILILILMFFSILFLLPTVKTDSLDSKANLTLLSVSKFQIDSDKYQSINTTYVDFFMPKEATHYYMPDGNDLYEVIISNMKFKGMNKDNILRITWNDKRYIKDTIKIDYKFVNGILTNSNIKPYSINSKTDLTFKNLKIELGTKLKEETMTSVKSNCGMVNKTRFVNNCFIVNKTEECYDINQTYPELFCNYTYYNVSSPVYSWEDWEDLDYGSPISFTATDDVAISACGTLGSANTKYNLTSNIFMSGGACMRITNQNVTLDCQGNYMISNSTSAGTTAFSVELGANNGYVEIKNCNVIQNTSNSYGLMDPTSGFAGSWFTLNMTNNTFLFNSTASLVGSSTYAISISNIFEWVNATIYNNNFTGYQAWIQGTTAGKGKNIQVFNNQINRCLWGYYAGMSNTTFYNNRFTKMIDGVFSIVYDSPGVSINNNYIEYGWATSASCYSSCSGTYIQAGYNIKNITNNIYVANASRKSWGMYLGSSGVLVSNNSISTAHPGIYPTNNNMTITPDNQVNNRSFYFNYSISNYEYNPTSAPNAGSFACFNCNNITIVNQTNITGNYGGIYFINTNNSHVINSRSFNNTRNIFFVSSNHNEITDSNFSFNYSSSPYSDAATEVFLGTTSTNNTFLNVTYRFENIATGNTLIRSWYYQAYVNDTLGLPVSNANVTSFNRTNAYQLNLTTDTTGYTLKFPMTEYTQSGGTKTYFYPFTIYGYNSSYDIQYSTFYNLNISRAHNIQLDIGGNVTYCRDLNTDGRSYFLRNNINHTGFVNTYCINVTAENVSFNGMYYNITNRSLAYSGIFINKFNTTIQNINVYSGVVGIYIANKANNTIINNVTVSFGGTGLRIDGNNTMVTNTLLTKQNSNNLQNSINVYNLYMNNVQLNTTLSCGSACSTSGFSMNLRDSNINNLSIFNISGGFTGTNRGISGSAYNTNFTNIRIVNLALNASSGIGMQLNTNNSYFDNIFITQVAVCISSSYAASGSVNNNVFQDGKLICNATDVQVIGAAPLSNNVTLINMTYNSSRETLSAGSQLNRMWYYQAKVNLSDGTDASFANVSVFNNSLVNIFNLTTDINGLSPRINLVEYRADNVVTNKTYFNNYTFIASYGDKTAISSHNITIDRNILPDFITILLSLCPLTGNCVISCNQVLTSPLNLNGNLTLTGIGTFNINSNYLNFTNSMGYIKFQDFGCMLKVDWLSNFLRHS